MGVRLELQVEGGAGDEEAPTDLRFAKVVGDNVKLTQVFRNLISNGLKFSKQDKQGKLTVRVMERSSPLSKRKDETILCGKEEVSVKRLSFR